MTFFKTIINFFPLPFRSTYVIAHKYLFNGNQQLLFNLKLISLTMFNKPNCFRAV